MRNPWAVDRGEWLGAWSDNSPLWNEVNPDVRKRLNFQSRGDGEFWMPMKDYMNYFTTTNVCNFTPDFNKDGTEDEGLG